MPDYGVVLSAELEEQLRRQPMDVQGEFLAVCDRLACLAMAGTIQRDQLTLPGLTDQPDRTDTHPLGFNGSVIHQFVGEG